MSLSGILKTVALAAVAGVVVANLVTSKSSDGNTLSRMMGKRKLKGGAKRQVGADSELEELRSPI